MSDNKRTFRIDVNEELLRMVEEQFCFICWKGEMIRVRSLTSVCKEAFLTGIVRMTSELEALREKFGDQVYLKARGIGFAELSLDEPSPDEESV